MKSTKDSLIRVENVSQEFGTEDMVVRPLNDVSFSLAKNSFSIIYGPSGSGKSTLLNVLTGLQSPTKGKVYIDDKDVYALSRDELANFRASSIGFIYQTNYWIKSLNVLDNVAMSVYFSGLTRKSAHKLAYEALEMVDMKSYAHKYPTMLSGGEQQRIATARALATNPSYIIADEPTGSLDSTNGDKIMSLLVRCQRDLDRTIILVTHNLEYMPLADKLLHIEDGRVKEINEGSIKQTTDVLFADMRSRMRRLEKAQTDVK